MLQALIQIGEEVTTRCLSRNEKEKFNKHVSLNVSIAVFKLPISYLNHDVEMHKQKPFSFLNSLLIIILP